jgi:hypothetical protein
MLLHEGDSSHIPDVAAGVGAPVTFGAAHAQYMGNYTANPFLPPAPPQPPGTFTNPYGTSFNSPSFMTGKEISGVT